MGIAKNAEDGESIHSLAAGIIYNEWREEGVREMGRRSRIMGGSILTLFDEDDKESI